MNKNLTTRFLMTALLSATLWIGTGAYAAETVIDFNAGTELANDFAGYESGTQFTQPATGGLSDSSFVSMDPSASDNYAVYQTPIDATTFDGAKVGGYFLYDGTTFASRPLSFGFTGAATDTYDASTRTTGIDLKVNLLGANNLSNTGIEIYNDGVAVATSSQNVTLTGGNWYYMELRIGGVSGGTFINVEAELFDSDSDGTIGSSLKLLNNSGSKYSVTNSLTTDTSVYAFFGGIGPGSRGIDGVDNLIYQAVQPPYMPPNNGFFPFNQSGDLDVFNTTGTALSQTTAVGLTNSGAIVFSTSDVNGYSTWNTSTPADTSGDFTLFHSTYFKTGTRTTGLRNGRRAVQFGLTDTNSVTYSGGGMVGEPSISAGLFVEYSLTNSSMIVEFYANKTGPSANYWQLTNQDLELNTNAWYFLQVDYNYNSASDSWGVSWQLNNSDSSGNLGTMIGSASSSSETASPFGTDPDLYGYFGTRSADRSNIKLLDNMTLGFAGVPSTYEEWITRFMLSTNTAFADDYDEDGADNGYEWATGTLPYNGQSIQPLTIDATNGNALIGFTRNVNATDVTITCRRKQDLTSGSWTTLASYASGSWTPSTSVSETGEGSTVNVEVSDSITALPSANYQLYITKP